MRYSFVEAHLFGSIEYANAFNFCLNSFRAYCKCVVCNYYLSKQTKKI